MVATNGVNYVVLKAKYGTDIRKSELHHVEDINFNDLVLMMQRFFQIKSSTNVLLKYRDSENDWITLANDDDVKFALQHEPYLYVEVFTGLNESSRASSPVNSDSMVATRISEKEEAFKPVPIGGGVLPLLSSSQQQIREDVTTTQQQPSAPSPLHHQQTNVEQQQNASALQEQLEKQVSSPQPPQQYQQQQKHANYGDASSGLPPPCSQTYQQAPMSGGQLCHQQQPPQTQVYHPAANYGVAPQPTHSLMHSTTGDTNTSAVGTPTPMIQSPHQQQFMQQQNSPIPPPVSTIGHSGNVSYGGSISQQQHTGFSSYQQSTPGQMPPAAQQQQQPPQPFGGVHPPPVSSVIGNTSGNPFSRGSTAQGFTVRPPTNFGNYFQ